MLEEGGGGAVEPSAEAAQAEPQFVTHEKRFEFNQFMEVTMRNNPQ